MRALTFILILVAVAVAAYFAYEKFNKSNIAEARRTLPTRLAAKDLRQGQPAHIQAGSGARTVDGRQ
jgi:cbb3-type cytochrome oxidase subunit 3